MAAPRRRGTGDLVDTRGRGDTVDFQLDIQRPVAMGDIVNDLHVLGNAQVDGDISTTGNVTLAQGKGLNVTTGGSAARAGTVILDNSLATVATTAITENSIVIMTYQAEDGAPGTLTVSARTPGVSFEISGDGVANISTVGWLIIEPV